MPSKSSGYKGCVTCDHWAGPRKPSTFRDSAIYESDQDTGECVGGGCNRLEKKALTICPKWSKWSALK